GACVLVRSPPVTWTTVHMIMSEDPPRVLELSWWFDRVGVVEAQHPYSVPVVQREAVRDSVRCPRRRLDAPRRDLDPVAIALVQDAPIQVQEWLDILVVHAMIVSPDDMNA